MDRGAWWATVQVMAKSRKRLRDSHCHFQNDMSDGFLLSTYEEIVTNSLMSKFFEMI